MTDRIKVIVADDNDITREMIVDFIMDDPQIEVVALAADGKETIDLIKKHRPNIVLLDLVMPMVDGLSVMEAVAEEMPVEMRPQYIVVSAAASEDIVNQALQTGAAYFIMKPFDGEALLRRIKKMCKPGEELDKDKKPSLQEVEQRVVSLLKELGVAPRMIGYKYLKDAIICAVDDMDRLNSVTKNVYPLIADKYDSSPNNVERNIRYSIGTAWERQCETEIKDEYKDVYYSRIKRPTNSEFIVSCVERVLYQGKK